MVNLERLTKAEILKLLQEEKDKVKSLEEQKAETEKLIDVDMSFKETKQERDLRNEKQMRKDFIKRMTRGRWVSEEKFDEHVKNQQNPGRVI